MDKFMNDTNINNNFIDEKIIAHLDNTLNQVKTQINSVELQTNLGLLGAYITAITLEPNKKLPDNHIVQAKNVANLMQPYLDKIKAL